MSPLQTVVLVVASLAAVAGGALVVHRELTAAGRRRVGIVRDVVEVLLPMAGLVLLLAVAWSRL